MRNKTVLVVFAKVPDKNIAKTRIAKAVGKNIAAKIYEELLEITSDIIQDTPYYISYTGAHNSNRLAQIFKNAVSFFPQIEGDLGKKMRHSFNYLFSLGYESVIAIGTDCPYITPADIKKSSDFLTTKDTVVIGPAYDGGYYLIGCRKESISVLNATKWSSSKLLKETLSIIKDKKNRLLLLDQKSDIDEIEDYNEMLTTKIIPEKINQH